MLNTLLAFDNLNPMNWEVIKHALNFLWQGLLAIFVVITLIIIAVKLTALCIDKAAETKANREKANTEEENTPQS